MELATDIEIFFDPLYFMGSCIRRAGKKRPTNAKYFYERILNRLHKNIKCKEITFKAVNEMHKYSRYDRIFL